MQPDILESAGFKKTKIGKSLGYSIERSKLRRLTGGIVFGLGIVSLIGVGSQFEVHFERRSFHRQIRKEEHHAANKLAKAEMELWSHYRDDIKESNEAATVLSRLSASTDSFQGRLKEAVEAVAANIGLKQDKAASLTGAILHLVADLQTNNTRLTKRLVDHLVNAGKKSVALETHAEKEALADVKEEEERQIEDDEDDEPQEQDEDNELKALLEGFWATFHDHEKEFAGHRAEFSKPDSEIYKQLEALHEKLISNDPPTDEDVSAELDGINMASLGLGPLAALGSGRSLPPSDLADELYLIPKIPHDKLNDLERDWKAGKKNTDGALEELLELQRKGLIPVGWMNMGVDQEEDEDERDEEREEEEEERGKEPREDD